MRLEALHVDGFGRFSDFHLEGLGPGLTVFHGDNEAGKSTLLAFIRAVLFGFPDGRSKDNPYPPLAGGQHGGRIVLVDSAGVRHTVQRHAGKRGGLVQVTSPGSPAGSEAHLSALMGSAGRGLFRNVFAFSLGELQQFESLGDDEVRATLYSAGLGAAVANLPGVERELAARAEEIFKPGGSKPRVNELLRRLEGVRGELAGLDRQPEAYRELQEQLEALGSRVRDLQEELEAGSRRRRHLEALLAAWPKWVGWAELEGQLDGLPGEPAFPTDGVARLEALLLRLGELRTRAGHKRHQWALLDRRLEELRPDSRLLAERQGIRRLGGGRSQWDQLRTDLPGARRQEEELDRQLRGRLAEIDPTWDPERLRGCDTSVAARNRVREHADALGRATRLRDQAAEQLQAAGRYVEEARELARLRAQELDRAPLPAPELEGLTAREIRDAQSRWRAADGEARRTRQEEREATRVAGEGLGRLGAGWNRERVLACEPDRAATEALRGHRERTGLAESGAREAETNLRTAERRARELEREVEGLQRDLEGLPSSRGDLDELREALFGARARLLERERHLARREAARQRLAAPEPGSEAPPAWIAPGLALLGLLLGGFLARQGLLVPAALMALTLLLLAGALAAWRFRVAVRDARRREEWDRQRLEARAALAEAEEQLRLLDEALGQAAARLGLGVPPSPEELDRLERELSREAGLQERRGALEQRLAQLRDLAGERQEELEAAREASTRALAERDQAREAWWGWLEERGLPEGLSPDSARDLLDEIRRVAEALHRQDGLAEEAGRARGRADELRAGLEDLLRRAGRTPSADGVDDPASTLAGDLDARDEHVRRREHLAERLREAEVEAERAEERLRERAGEAGQAEAALAGAQGAWESGRGELPTGSPETVLQILQRAEVAQDLLAQRDRVRADREEKEAALDRLHQEACRLFHAVGRPEPRVEELAPELDRLLADLDAAEHQGAEREQLLRQREADPEPPELLERGVAAAEAELEALVRSAGVGDEEAFRRAAEAAASHASLRREADTLRRELAAAAGARPFEEFVADLDGADPEELARELERLEREGRELRDRLGEAQRDQGRTQKELEGLERSDERARLRQEQETLQEGLEVESRRWAALAMARRLLQEARERYERERQPDVIRRAGEHFARMTGGRYPRLFAPALEKRVLVERPDGTRLETHELSRGTAEQLYLALRLGFVHEFSRRSEPLPLVMDDIFVNFDPGRARAALEEVRSLADRHQVLLFTCHPETVERVRRVEPEVSVRNLEGGSS